MPKATSPNGSVKDLAAALRGVVVEAITEAVAPVKGGLDYLTEEVVKLDKKIDDRADATNENMQKQFAEVQRQFGEIERQIEDVRAEVVSPDNRRQG